MHSGVWEKLSLHELSGLNATLHTYLKGGRLRLQKYLLIQAAFLELIRGFLTAGRENNLVCSSGMGLLRLYHWSDLCSEESLHREPNLRSVCPQSAQLNPEPTSNPPTCASRVLEWSRDVWKFRIKLRCKSCRLPPQLPSVKQLFNHQRASLALPPCSFTSVPLHIAMETHWRVNVKRYAPGGFSFYTYAIIPPGTPLGWANL